MGPRTMGLSGPAHSQPVNPMMKHLLPAIVLAVLVLVNPNAARASVGATLTAGAGVNDLNHSTDTKFRTAIELSPFIEKWILRVELPLEMTVAPEQSFALRPGVKLILPFFGIYVRAGYGWGNLGGEGAKTHTAIVGAGKQFTLLDTLGILIEATGEPQIAPAHGTPTNLMLRAGLLLNL